MNRLLSLDGAADRLGVGRSTTKTLLGRGRLKSLKLGKRRLVPEAAIDELIAELERERDDTNESVA
jgi:excisionase family DNA binding protein